MKSLTDFRTIFGLCIIWIVVNTVFMQFLHYDAQNHLLNPQHYDVDVITQGDYKQISNPENKSVELSNGKRYIVKAEGWQANVLPKYKPVNNGSQYVLVTLRGAAPFMTRWYSGVIPIFIICSFGLFFGIKKQK